MTAPPTAKAMLVKVEVGHVDPQEPRCQPPAGKGAQDPDDEIADNPVAPRSHEPTGTHPAVSPGMIQLSMFIRNTQFCLERCSTSCEQVVDDHDYRHHQHQVDDRPQVGDECAKQPEQK